METKVNYTLVGLFVVILGAALVYVSFWLTEGRHAKSYDTYMIYMDEAASGLTEQAPVKFNGVDVGYIKKVKINLKNTKQVILLLKIEKNTPVNESALAVMKLQGITGITYIDIKIADANAPILTAKPGEPYPIIKYHPSVLTHMYETFGEIAQNITVISDALKTIFDEEGRLAFKKSLHNIADVTGMLSRNKAYIESTIRNMQGMTKQLAQAGHSVSKTMKTGRATLETFNQQALPGIVTLMQKLEALAAKLEMCPSEILWATRKGTIRAKVSPGS